MSRAFLKFGAESEKWFRIAYPQKDVQCRTPKWCCCRCGGEQYEWDDETGMEDGSFLCARCRMEEEEK